VERTGLLVEEDDWWINSANFEKSGQAMPGFPPKSKCPFVLFQQGAAPEIPVVPMRQPSMQTEDSDAGGVFAFVHTPAGLVVPQRSQLRAEPEGMPLTLCALVCCFLKADIRNGNAFAIVCNASVSSSVVMSILPFQFSCISACLRLFSTPSPFNPQSANTRKSTTQPTTPFTKHPFLSRKFRP
jgi:hypothetical protein